MIDSAITAHNIIAWSLLGGAAKTHDDYKQKKVGKVMVTIALIVNSAYATMFGYMAVQLWLFLLPDMNKIAFIIAFTAGFIGANIIAIIKRIDWVGMFEEVVNRWIK